MTQRLYYDDSHLVRFSAHVVERLSLEDHPAVVLDRTAFYPTGGGQPHETGWLNGVAVVDVVEREADEAVIHALAAPLEAEEVEGLVDWQRRFDLMQQHSGQHILSAAFLEHLDANTVSFHLSETTATIDLDRAPLATDQLAEVEALANTVVLQNRPAVARFVPDEEMPTLPLRKAVIHAGPVRVVQIADFDCSACGGTHVHATGEVGLIKITRSERRGGDTRVEFVCGGRALVDYAAKNAVVMGLAQEFTVGHWELADHVHRLVDELQETRRELRRTRDALLDAEASAFWHQALSLGPVRLVRAHFPERTPDELKFLAQRLIAQPQTAALLGSGQKATEKGHLVFARSADVDVHMGTLMRQACEVIGGRGGGRPEFAQGGAPKGDQVAEALDAARLALQQLMDTRGQA
jgi:alanyl-tRNA synthetase